MVVAIGIGLSVMGLAVGLLGILCTYIWKGNQKMEKALLAGQERLMAGLEKLMAGQERLMAGQETIVAGLERLEEGQKEIAQMLLNQTRILERIEAKIPMPAS